MKALISPRHYLPISFLVSAFAAVSASADTVVYSESFDPAPDSFTEFNIQLGGDPDLRPTNTRIVDKGVWGLTAFGRIVDIGGDNGNVLQPQELGRNNSRIAGVFLDPAHFAATGAGTYTLSFDVIPTSNAGSARVYVGAGSGYDLSGDTDARLNLSLAADGFGVRRPTGLIIWPALTASNGATATHLITTPTEWILADGTETGEFRDTPGAPFDIQTEATLAIDFEYDGTSTLVIAFGGYNTDFQIDNITIAPAVEEELWAGFPFRDDGFVDTGDFLGLLWIMENGFVWSDQLRRFIYLPEEFVSESGAWIYVPGLLEGYPFTTDGFVDTGDFLGLLWVTDSIGFAWSVQLRQFIYLSEESVSESGAWILVLR